MKNFWTFFLAFMLLCTCLPPSSFGDTDQISVEENRAKAQVEKYVNLLGQLIYLGKEKLDNESRITSLKSQIFEWLENVKIATFYTLSWRVVVGDNWSNTVSHNSSNVYPPNSKNGQPLLFLFCSQEKRQNISMVGFCKILVKDRGLDPSLVLPYYEPTGYVKGEQSISLYSLANAKVDKNLEADQNNLGRDYPNTLVNWSKRFQLKALGVMQTLSGKNKMSELTGDWKDYQLPEKVDEVVVDKLEVSAAINLTDDQLTTGNFKSKIQISYKYWILEGKVDLYIKGGSKDKKKRKFLFSLNLKRYFDTNGISETFKHFVKRVAGQTKIAYDSTVTQDFRFVQTSLLVGLVIDALKKDRVFDLPMSLSVGVNVGGSNISTIAKDTDGTSSDDTVLTGEITGDYVVDIYDNLRFILFATLQNNISHSIKTRYGGKLEYDVTKKFKLSLDRSASLICIGSEDCNKLTITVFTLTYKF